MQRWPFALPKALEVLGMLDFRCSCKKIIFQIEGDSVLIKCRHCKRYIQINTKGIVNFQYKLGPDEIIIPENLPRE